MLNWDVLSSYLELQFAWKDANLFQHKTFLAKELLNIWPSENRAFLINIFWAKDLLSIESSEPVTMIWLHKSLWKILFSRVEEMDAEIVVLLLGYVS